MERSQIRVSRAVTPTGVLEDAVITVEDGRIVSVEPGESGEADEAGLWAVPGFVDTHTHGAVGVSFGDPMWRPTRGPVVRR